MKGFLSNPHKSSEHRIDTFFEMITLRKANPLYCTPCTLIQNDDIFRLICKPLRTIGPRIVASVGQIEEMVRYQNKVI